MPRRIRSQSSFLRVSAVKLPSSIGDENSQHRCFVNDSPVLIQKNDKTSHSRETPPEIKENLAASAVERRGSTGSPEKRKR